MQVQSNTSHIHTAQHAHRTAHAKPAHGKSGAASAASAQSSGTAGEAAVVTLSKAALKASEAHAGEGNG